MSTRLAFVPLACALVLTTAACGAPEDDLEYRSSFGAPGDFTTYNDLSVSSSSGTLIWAHEKNGLGATWDDGSDTFTSDFSEMTDSSSNVIATFTGIRNGLKTTYTPTGAYWTVRTCSGYEYCIYQGWSLVATFDGTTFRNAFGTSIGSFDDFTDDVNDAAEAVVFLFANP